ncbi:MAG: hypothetical protein AVDCRST_MAG66-3019 [uncultured Pseudonocardia sp.]|uniref:Uncharacterized protein n=1 Tax=uncultured Pseudonocardia sp. TaxID=211455 RepID=A0A6J4PV52_9PSEU|nr:MAG: hypothetical protein AVDCRST_MAG66-3019 [uncultured Pseudonocardia sp.]
MTSCPWALLRMALVGARHDPHAPRAHAAAGLDAAAGHRGGGGFRRPAVVEAGEPADFPRALRDALFLADAVDRCRLGRVGRRVVRKRLRSSTVGGAGPGAAGIRRGVDGGAAAATAGGDGPAERGSDERESSVRPSPASAGVLVPPALTASASLPTGDRAGSPASTDPQVRTPVVVQIDFAPTHGQSKGTGTVLDRSSVSPSLPIPASPGRHARPLHRCEPHR